MSDAHSNEAFVRDMIARNGMTEETERLAMLVYAARTTEITDDGWYVGPAYVPEYEPAEDGEYERDLFLESAEDYARHDTPESWQESDANSEG